MTMVLQGSCISGIWTIKFSVSREDDVWRVETRDPYNVVVDNETAGASPFALLEAELAAAINRCRNRVPERAPRPALKIQRDTQEAEHPSRLGPRRKIAANDGDAA
jgi:hypothetical protein